MPKQPETKHWLRNADRAMEAVARQHLYEPGMTPRERKEVRDMMTWSGQPLAQEYNRQIRMVPFEMRHPRPHPDFIRALLKAPDPKPLKRLGKGRVHRRVTRRTGRGRKRAAPKRRRPVRRGTGRRRAYQRRRR